MQPDAAYEFFSNQLMRNEILTIKNGKGGLSYYKNGVFVCHFNAKPQKNRDDLGFADFRYDALRSYLDIDRTISAIRNEILPEVEIKSHKLWCSLHFPLSKLEHIAELFLKHIISKVNNSSKQENTH
ncbi:MAG TPA: hypothetical protein VJM08_13495 [Anaerolineales bacterium]|nr:hypothetical protein [Anaerolineales bacterium]